MPIQRATIAGELTTIELYQVITSSVLNKKKKGWLVNRGGDEAYEESFEDMPRRVPDTSKINELVGFKPEDDS